MVEVRENDVDEAVGRHCIAELYEGCPEKLNSESFIREALTEAAKRSGATLLSLTSHNFTPQGVTALALLSESHLSIHTWPELGYAAVDAFTCGAHTDPEVACLYLKEALTAERSTLKMLERAIPSINRRQFPEACDPIQDAGQTHR
jgi:S-adenosylmethionine decarboxylase